MASWDQLDPVVAAHSAPPPCFVEVGGVRTHRPDWVLLSSLLAAVFPATAGRGWDSVAIGHALDLWLAEELRRCGFGTDEVWPRASDPRVLPRELAVLMPMLARKGMSLGRFTSIVLSEARVLGATYEKEVDVLMSRWETGPQLIVSTKSMLGAYGKNANNRMEEAYGDAHNLRGRFPLAALGYLLLLGADCPRTAFERLAAAMVRMQDSGTMYDRTCLIVVEPIDRFVARRRRPVRVYPRAVARLVPGGSRPRAARFVDGMVRCVLERTPPSYHEAVRVRFY